MVRTAVLKGKDPMKLLEEMEMIDRMGKQVIFFCCFFFFSKLLFVIVLLFKSVTILGSSVMFNNCDGHSLHFEIKRKKNILF